MLTSLRAIVDLIIGYDDGSTDGSAELVQDFGGQLVEIPEKRPHKEGGEFDFRTGLLHAGRKANGSHFVCLDADEAISCDFLSAAPDWLGALQAGQCLDLQWTMLWESCKGYRSDIGTWYPSFKDFAFRDAPGLEYPQLQMHLPRTPATRALKPLRVPAEQGRVLHYQFAFPERTILKQTWYMCIEFLEGHSAWSVNSKYLESVEWKGVAISKVPRAWLSCLPEPSQEWELASDWRLHDILGWFHEYGPEHFEALNIWRIKELEDCFAAQVGRKPRPSMLRSRIRAQARRIKHSRHRSS